MPQFGDLPLTVLRSISAASGDDYGDIDEPELRREMVKRGVDPSDTALRNVMRRLQDDGYVDCYLSGGPIGAIHLDTLGRQAVEGWPTSPGAISAEEVQELIGELESAADDATRTPEERSAARAAGQALRDLGVSITSTLISGWAQRHGVP